jgi:hypothetical protein
VKPIEKRAASSKPSARQGKPLKALPARAERIHFHGKGEVDVDRGSTNEPSFDDDWDMAVHDQTGIPCELPALDVVGEVKVEIACESDQKGNGGAESPVEAPEDSEEPERNRFEMVIQSVPNKLDQQKPEKDNFEVSFEENEDDPESPQEPSITPIVTPREQADEDFGLSLEFPDME